MSQTLSDLFARETNEYLDGLVQALGSTQPEPDRLYRAARGVRGSAQIAGVTRIAAVMEPMEAALRPLRDGKQGLTPELRMLLEHSATELRELVRAQPAWGAPEEARAAELQARWSAIATNAAPRPTPTIAAEERLSAFVQREVDGVATELDRALAAGDDPEIGAPLVTAVLQRMRAVRGVTGVASLAPVLEVLAGTEDRVKQTLARSAALGGASAPFFVAARDALRAAAASLARGEPIASDSAELARFRQLRDTADTHSTGTEADVVSVRTLFFDDDGPHLVASPVAPIPPADSAESAEVFRFVETDATGFLDRAEAMLAPPAAGATRDTAALVSRLAELAAGVRELAATFGVDRIARAADAAIEPIRRAAGVSEVRAALAPLRAALGMVDAVAPAITATAPAPTSTAASTADAAGVAADDRDVVPVEQLLLRGEAALRAALALRDETFALLDGTAADGLRGRLEEIFDLIELGRDAGTPGS